MIGSIFASAIAATGLFGTMSTRTCVNGVTSAISCSTRLTGLAPTPGSKTTAEVNAVVTAIPVVTM